MQYKKAEKEHVTQIYQLVQDTIQAVYPKYYPPRIVSQGYLYILNFTITDTEA